MGIFSFLNPSRRKMAGMVNHSSRKVNRKDSFPVRLWKSKPLCRVVVLLLILAASVYSMISRDRMPVRAGGGTRFAGNGGTGGIAPTGDG